MRIPGLPELSGLNTARKAKEDIERIIGSGRRLLNHAGAQPEKRIQRLPIDVDRIPLLRDALLPIRAELAMVQEDTKNNERKEEHRAIRGELAVIGLIILMIPAYLIRQRIGEVIPDALLRGIPDKLVPFVPAALDSLGVMGGFIESRLHWQRKKYQKVKREAATAVWKDQEAQITDTKVTGFIDSIAQKFHIPALKELWKRRDDFDEYKIVSGILKAAGRKMFVGGKHMRETASAVEGFLLDRIKENLPVEQRLALLRKTNIIQRDHVFFWNKPKFMRSVEKELAERFKPLESAMTPKQRALYNKTIRSAHTFGHGIGKLVGMLPFVLRPLGKNIEKLVTESASQLSPQAMEQLLHIRYDLQRAVIPTPFRTRATYLSLGREFKRDTVSQQDLLIKNRQTIEKVEHIQAAASEVTEAHVERFLVGDQELTRALEHLGGAILHAQVGLQMHAMDFAHNPVVLAQADLIHAGKKDNENEKLKTAIALRRGRK